MNTQLAAAGSAPTRGDGQDRPGRPPQGARDWVRAALSPRMVGVLLILLLAAGACFRLGAWQFDRAAVRGATEARAAHAERLSADPQPISQVLPAQTSFPADAVGRRVTAVGAFAPEQQVLVPDRSVEGEPATLVVTAFWLSEGPDAGAMLPVVRGWLPPQDVVLAQDGPRPADEEVAEALAAPAGELELTGYLAGSEASAPGDYPEGVVGAVSTGELANRWGGPSWSGYAVLERAEPADGGADGADAAAGAAGPLSLTRPPAMAGETGMNLQNLAYAAEWWIFGAFALLLGWRLLRDEVREERADTAAAAGPGA